MNLEIPKKGILGGPGISWDTYDGFVFLYIARRTTMKSKLASKGDKGAMSIVELTASIFNFVEFKKKKEFMLIGHLRTPGVSRDR